jgi:hypothetical protein
MKEQNKTTMRPNDAEFHIAFGWLTALSVSIASLAVLA